MHTTQNFVMTALKSRRVLTMALHDQEHCLGLRNSVDRIESSSGVGTIGVATTTMEVVPLHLLQLQQVALVRQLVQVRDFAWCRSPCLVRISIRTARPFSQQIAMRQVFQHDPPFLATGV